jgi:putative ATPase
VSHAKNNDAPNSPLHVPLAERLRPRTLGEVVGQQHLLGEGMALRIAFESGRPHSCILWGPPGTGKTTIRGSWPKRSTRSSSPSARCSAA